MFVRGFVCVTKTIIRAQTINVACSEQLNIFSICAYGGGDRREQRQKLKSGVEIVVATPGRLNDFMNCGALNVKNVTYLVSGQ